jgi:hypothetical protein
MCELAWQDSDNPQAMLGLLPKGCSKRKLRLMAVACCRWVWPLLNDERSRNAVETAERFADNLASEIEADAAKAYAAGAIPRRNLTRGVTAGTRKWREARIIHSVTRAAWYTISSPQYARHVAQLTARVAEQRGLAWHRAEGHWQCHLLRDIFGNPFRPLPPRPEVIAPLAEQIYAGEWDKMPLLGEWLQEHGYWGEGEHCLDTNIKHVKGCWVVDWVTGRE